MSISFGQSWNETGKRVTRWIILFVLAFVVTLAVLQYFDSKRYGWHDATVIRVDAGNWLERGGAVYELESGQRIYIRGRSLYQPGERCRIRLHDRELEDRGSE